MGRDLLFLTGHWRDVGEELLAAVPAAARAHRRAQSCAAPYLRIRPPCGLMTLRVEG